MCSKFVKGDKILNSDLKRILIILVISGFVLDVSYSLACGRSIFIGYIPLLSLQLLVLLLFAALLYCANVLLGFLRSRKWFFFGGSIAFFCLLGFGANFIYNSVADKSYVEAENAAISFLKRPIEREAKFDHDFDWNLIGELHGSTVELVPFYEFGPYGQYDFLVRCNGKNRFVLRVTNQDVGQSVYLYEASRTDNALYFLSKNRKMLYVKMG